MKVILLKDVPKLGHRYEVKEVSSGHALNLLIPRGDAVAATPAALKKAEAHRAKAEAERQVRADLIAKNLDDLDGQTLTIAGKANDKGHLFAGLHREELAAEIEKQTRLAVDPSYIQIEQPIKTVGEHAIEIAAGGKSAKLKLVVI